MFPCDIETFKTGEHVISAFSIPVGSPKHGKSEPLWTTAQMRAYVDADRAAAQAERDALREQLARALEFPYTETFNAIAAATNNKYPNAISISVSAFKTAYSAAIAAGGKT
jgi:hypothetical protein